jgi:hypothetical protein
MTAEEINAATGIGLNNTRSRATEHLTGGRFKVLRKKLNAKKTRSIAVYEVA